MLVQTDEPSGERDAGLALGQTLASQGDSVPEPGGEAKVIGSRSWAIWVQPWMRGRSQAVDLVTPALEVFARESMEERTVDPCHHLALLQNLVDVNLHLRHLKPWVVFSPTRGTVQRFDDGSAYYVGRLRTVDVTQPDASLRGWRGSRDR